MKVFYQYSTCMLGFLRLECKMQLSHPRVLDLRKQIYIHYLTFLWIYFNIFCPRRIYKERKYFL